ncbi:MAG: HEAT repeat domain-containing protein [candidate division Zixibacteria bacterium]|nr:HEAT repeat domain-containing protein [candidate division Zixibacteria bacterium]
MSQQEEINNKELEDIRYILKDFLKVIKVVTMYPEDNPLPQSLKQSFSEKLESVANEYGPINIVVEKEFLVYKNEVVFRDRSKEESLAGLFFNTGITRFTMQQTLSVDEIYKLLDTFKDFLNAPKNSCDLAGLIWEAEISDFKFSTVEDIALSGYDGKIEEQFMSGGSSGMQADHTLFGADDEADYGAIFDHASLPPDSVDSSQPVETNLDDTPSKGIPEGGSIFYSHVYRDLDDERSAEVVEREQALNTAAAAEAMGFADIAPAPSVPNTTLILNDEFKLSEEEENEFGVLLDEDNNFDMFESTAEILKEILHQEIDISGFSESVTISEKVISELVRAGALDQAASVLSYMGQLEERIASEKPKWAERLKETTITAGSRDRLQILLEGLNEHPEIDELKIRSYLNNLGWESLAGVTEIMGEIEHRSHRDAFNNYLSQAGQNKVDIISRGIFDKRWFVVRNAAIVLARIGDDKALSYLEKIADHEEQRVRIAIVEHIKESKNPRALKILAQTVMDEDPEVRRSSINSIIGLKGQGAFDVIEGIVKDSGFSDFDPTDQELLLEAYSIIGGDKSVSFLTRKILKYVFFRSARATHLRRASMEALAINRSERAEKALIKLSGSWRANIRNLATKAMNKRRSILYGDIDAEDS